MKCKELAEEYGITAMRVGKIRRERWRKATGDLTEKHIEHVRSVLDRQPRTDKSIESHKPNIVTVVITHRGNLSRYMECMERGKPGRFHLLMPFGANKDNFSVGQQIQAAKVKHDGKELYIHSICASITSYSSSYRSWYASGKLHTCKIVFQSLVEKQ